MVIRVRGRRLIDKLMMSFENFALSLLLSIQFLLLCIYLSIKKTRERNGGAMEGILFIFWCLFVKGLWI